MELVELALVVVILLLVVLCVITIKMESRRIASVMHIITGFGIILIVLVLAHLTSRVAPPSDSVFYVLALVLIFILGLVDFWVIYEIEKFKHEDLQLKAEWTQELLGKFKVFEKKDIKNQAELIRFILGLIAAVEKDDVQKFEKMLSQANDDNPSQSQQP